MQLKMGDQEVLHLSIEVMREGTLYLREFAYMTTQEVFTRVSKMEENHDENGYSTTGWNRLNGPDGNPVCVSLDVLDKLAFIAKRKGWEVLWNVNYDPALQAYVKRTDF
jgi:hypothetical protein